MDKLSEMYKELLKAEREARGVANRPMRLVCVCKLSASLPEGRRFVSLGRISIGGRGPKQRVAVVDQGACCVYVFRLEDMKLLWVAGSKGQGPGQFMYPAGSAFDGRGHLFVSDYELCRVQEFDCEGGYVRCFGKQGSGAGELSGPWGISVSAQGDTLVCDWGNDRVQVFDGDGRFVRVVPSPDDPQQVGLSRPTRVFAAADGNMIVADLDCVRMFSRDGLFVKEIKPPHVQGEHWNVYGMCAGPRGELVAIEADTLTVRVLDADGALLWTAKYDDEYEPWGTAMDWKGQLLCKPWGIQEQDVYVCKPEPFEAS
jgi:sugar lactone lactonase YvrE